MLAVQALRHPLYYARQFTLCHRADSRQGLQCQATGQQRLRRKLPDGQRDIGRIRTPLLRGSHNCGESAPGCSSTTPLRTRRSWRSARRLLRTSNLRGSTATSCPATSSRCSRQRAATRRTLSAAPLMVAISASITCVGPAGWPKKAGQLSGSISTSALRVGSDLVVTLAGWSYFPSALAGMNFIHAAALPGTQAMQELITACRKASGSGTPGSVKRTWPLLTISRVPAR